MKRVKGFTLIELIVVLAIFSIIMFAATSLMTPASKIMTNAENMENGSAAVSSISKYLETELSTAEYLNVYGYKVDEGNFENMVAEFAGTYYGGVLRAGTEPNAADPAYGNGIVHVLQFDNADPVNGGMITKWDYEIKSFKAQKNGDGKYFKVEPANVQLKSSYSPVNKAYYDSYNFTIIPGTIQNVASFDEVYQNLKLGDMIWNDTDGDGVVDDDEKTDVAMSVLSNIKATNTAFSIRATRKEKCKVCRADYHMDAVTGKMVCDCSPSTTPRQFVNVAAMSLVNIYQRDRGGVAGHYFVIHDGFDKEGNPKKEIVDRATDALSDYIDIKAGYKYEPKTETDKVENAVSAAEGFTFIYSYGSEQDTSAP